MKEEIKIEVVWAL